MRHSWFFLTQRWKRDSSGEKVMKEGKPVLEIVAIQRRDCKEWALPGVGVYLHVYLVQFCSRSVIVCSETVPQTMPKSHFVNRGMGNWSPKRGGHCGEVWLLELCTCCLKTLWNPLWKHLAIVAYNFKESHTFITVIIKDRKVNAWKICLLCKTVANSKRCCPTIISNNVQMYPFRVW